MATTDAHEASYDGGSAGKHSIPPAPSLDATAFNLLEALRQPDCPICHLTAQAVSSYLDWTAYESVNDPQVREQLRRALGYCAPHGQQWLGLKDTLATAIIYRDILTELRRVVAPFVAGGQGQVRAHTGKEAGKAVETEEAVRDTTDGPADGAAGGIMRKLQTLLSGEQASVEAGHALADALEPAGPCPACRYTLEVERRLVESCAQALSDERFAQAYRRHPFGLCLPHLRAVLRRASPQIAGMLARFLLDTLTDTCARLDEVVRKYDYRFRHEARGHEFEAPARSVRLAAGTLPTGLKLPAGSGRPGRRGGRRA